MAHLKTWYPVFGSTLLENYLKRGKTKEFNFSKDLKEGNSTVRIHFLREGTDRKFTMSGKEVNAFELIKLIVKKVKEIKEIKLSEVWGSKEDPILSFWVSVETGYQGTKKIKYSVADEGVDASLLFAVKGLKEYIEEVNSTREAWEASKKPTKPIRLDFEVLNKFVKWLGYLKDEAVNPVDISVSITQGSKECEIWSCSGSCDTNKLVMLKNALKKRFKDARISYLENSDKSISYKVELPR